VTKKALLDRRWPWLLAATVILLAVLSTMLEFPHDWDTRPTGSAADIEALKDRADLNVLFILVDTLRAEHLGSYGYARDTSPFLDRFAASGIRFTRHLSQSSWTKASMASLWMAKHPPRAGITRFDQVIPEDALMPAEVLREAGFQTVGLYRNGWVAPTFGFDQGFDVYKRPVFMALDPSVRRENPTLSEATTDESALASAMEFLRLHGKERWFLYLHLMDVHEYLYDEESALFGSNFRGIYDNSIRFTDGVLETLFASLAEAGYLDNTLVILTSDHGEAFGERGFEGHARKVYRETTEIPFVLSFPFKLEPATLVETRTSNVDVWPTVFDLLGLEFPGVDGRSRVPEILASVKGEEAPHDDVPSFAYLDQTWARPDQEPSITVAVAEGNLRYVRIEQTSGVIEQLFDSTDDPQELRDRAREDAETVERLGAVAVEYMESRPAWGDSPTREIGELELNHLRALGYAIP
jgi:arylsulfatase A-like enzyme